jgi:thiazole synthase
MEMGCDAVLVNSAIAAADAPATMAEAFAMATRAGRIAFHAGLMARTGKAAASSPLTSFLAAPRANP